MALNVNSSTCIRDLLLPKVLKSSIWKASGHLLRYNLTSAINLMYNATHSGEKFTPKSLNGLGHHKGSKNEPSKQTRK